MKGRESNGKLYKRAPQLKKNENYVESSSINEEFAKLVKNRYSFELKKIRHKIVDSKRKSKNN